MSPFDSVEEFDLSGVSVSIGIPCGPCVFPYQTTQAIAETVMALKDRGVPFELNIVAGCSLPHKARNLVAKAFFAGNKNRLFMIDADMTWKPEDFIRMLCLSTRMEVLTAPYPAKMDPVTFMLGEQSDVMTSNAYGCLPINGMGLGFAVVSRAAMESLLDRAVINKADVAQIFRCDMYEGDDRGEDMAFFADLRSQGYQIWMDPTIQLGHIGQRVFSGSIMDALEHIG